MTREEYFARFGDWPIQDDLERVNCPLAGKVGHWGCGVCEKHDLPMFLCWVCLVRQVVQPSITCPRCKLTSFNPNDVAQRYCGHCQQFHEETT